MQLRDRILREGAREQNHDRGDRREERGKEGEVDPKTGGKGEEKSNLTPGHL